MKFGILAPGHIAEKMATTVKEMPEVQRVAVASRSLEKAQDFARTWGFERAYGSYAELVADPEVELIYVASPHSHHYEHARLCLEAGKNILVEKAFTVNRRQAAELLDLAREKGLLVAEAIWTRYMPARTMIDQVLASGRIGAPRSLYASLCYPLTHVERMRDPKLAAGALLDLGVYTLNFARMVFGHDLAGEITALDAQATLSDLGVDQQDSITLRFAGGQMAILHASMLGRSNRMGIINCEQGYIEVQNINNPEEIRVYDTEDKLLERLEVPEQITGFEYQVRACARALAAGQIEVEEMPHAEILHIMDLMDQVRSQIEVSYPGE